MTRASSPGVTSMTRASSPGLVEAGVEGAGEGRRLLERRRRRVQHLGRAPRVTPRAAVIPPSHRGSTDGGSTDGTDGSPAHGHGIDCIMHIGYIISYIMASSCSTSSTQYRRDSAFWASSAMSQPHLLQRRNSGCMMYTIQAHGYCSHTREATTSPRKRRRRRVQGSDDDDESKEATTTTSPRKRRRRRVQGSDDDHESKEATTSPSPVS
jgi:hypothetical protein